MESELVVLMPDCPAPKKCSSKWWLILVGVALVVGLLALVLTRVTKQMISGLVGIDPETTCHWWKPIDWESWLPQDLKSSDRDTFVFAANLLKYTYQKACKEVEGTFPNVPILEPPSEIDFKEWIYAVDRGRRQLFGFVSIYKKQFLVITLRGSMVLDNWITDAHYKQVEWLDGHMVHEGFLRTAETTFAQLDSAIAKYPNLPIFIAGHSLGAGMTGIVSYYLWSKTGRGERYIKSIVFGCPRTGDPGFAETLSRNVVCFNVQNLADLVVDVPLSVMPHLFGKPYVYQHWDVVKSFTLDMGAVPDNHHIETYLRAVETLPPFSNACS